MLTAIKNNRSLTFYQQPLLRDQIPDSTQQSYHVSSMPVTAVTATTGRVTNSYNDQLCRYLNTCRQQQRILVDQTNDFMAKKLLEKPDATNAQLRNKGNWGNVKKLVTREELMKLQISKKCDYPLTNQEQKELYLRIKDMDLSQMDDKDIQQIIDDLIETDDKRFLEALKQFKATGKPDAILQSKKLDALREDLKNIDLTKITGEQYKRLKNNYCEQTEFHHRTSISSDPTKQSVTDNVEPLNTTDHDAKHTDPETNKVCYKKPVNEKPLNRQKDMQDGNKKRVRENELNGLKTAVAIAAGVGLTIGVITTLARSGISPDSVKAAAINGLACGTESGALAAVSFGIGRTLGESAKQAIIGHLGTIATDNIIKMVDMGVIGGLSILVFSVYQFTKLKLSGVATRQALVQVGKQALISLSVLAVSIAAQGVFGGAAGIIVATAAGLITVTYSITDAVHQRNFAERIRVYTIEQYTPYFA